MSAKNIVNIINFIRNCDSRDNIDLVLPVKNQLNLLKKHGLKGTFLLQYDALINPAYSQLLKEHSDFIEVGCWLEIVKELTDSANIAWQGRENLTWDWHSNSAMSVGYTLEQRESIVDAYMAKFMQIFGYYPSSVGAWSLDAHTLLYLETKYNIKAACNCKDQWGTDGYTLWGGYYNQAYYPSKNNYFCPAQSKEQQINVPLFRMLGSDPVYQYDNGLDVDLGSASLQGVVTLEPVYKKGGGGDFRWVDWYLDENFNNKSMGFSYTQAGQENSFGWDAMKDGLIYQLDKLEKMHNDGLVEVLTLKEAGEWFCGQYDITPPTTIVAESDYNDMGHKSVWFNCKNYRINIFAKDDKFWIRDIFKFDQDYKERYFEKPCDNKNHYFDNLPIIDGNIWSGNGIRAGLYPMDEQGAISFDNMSYSENDSCAFVTFSNKKYGKIVFTLCEDSITVDCEGKGFMLKFVYCDSKKLAVIKQNGNSLEYNYNGYNYSLSLFKGEIKIIDGAFCIAASNGKIALKMDK